MNVSKDFVNELKRVLEHTDSPERLDEHPWAAGLVVRERAAADAALSRRSPGYRLLAAMVALGRELQPSTPPRRGKRLDTGWGQFGLLAALYLAPFETGTLRPRSIRDAWGRIDQAIAQCVFGAAIGETPEAELGRYQLVGGETDAYPASTLSDWHVQALAKLAGLLARREAHLAEQFGEPPVIRDGTGRHPDDAAPVDATVLRGRSLRADHSSPKDSASNADGTDEDLEPIPSTGETASDYPLPGSSARPRRMAQPGASVRWLWLAGLLVVIGLAGAKGIRLQRLSGLVKADVARLEALLPPDAGLDALISAGPALGEARAHVDALRAEARPAAALARWLAWAPVGGGADLMASGELLDFAGGLAAAADEAGQGLGPFWEAMQDEAASPSPSELVALLELARPHLDVAQASLTGALAARDALPVDDLSPASRALVASMDARASALQDLLAAATVGPSLLGGDAPRTYLLLAQNEDELRATGGFIEAAGVVTVVRGEIVGLKFEDAYAVDDLSKPYFYAPEPLRRFMAADIWLLRDVNWSPDFPTTARMAEALYTYTRPGRLDGVIAFDETALRLILDATGPVRLSESEGWVNADNLLDAMRASWTPPPTGTAATEAGSLQEDFLGRLASALADRLRQGPPIDWAALAGAIRQGLDERHILIQVNDPIASAALGRRGWDGAIRPGQGDYLMVVDSNLGFNKANAAVEMSLDYAVDLSDPAHPAGTLTVTHVVPPLAGDVNCRHAPAEPSASYTELVAGCYWDYLRVYVPEGSRLAEAAPHEVPAAWTLLGEAAPARVDALERINGSHGLGTFLVVPVGERLDTRFAFDLSPTVVTSDAGAYRYLLRVQKQPGARPIPLSLRVRLPAGAALVGAVPAEGSFRQGDWRADLMLERDVEVEVVFR